MRIFKDLEMVEQLGSGIPLILEHYGNESFKFSDNFLRMTFATKASTENSAITYNEIAETLGINESAVGKHINAIKDNGFLERKEGTRGYWEVNVEDN